MGPQESGTCTLRMELTAKREVQFCKLDAVDKENETTLGWWGTRPKIYPHIARLTVTKKWLSVSANSVPSERFYSLSGAIVSCLSPKNTHTLVF